MSVDISTNSPASPPYIAPRVKDPNFITPLLILIIFAILLATLSYSFIDTPRSNSRRFAPCSPNLVYLGCNYYGSTEHLQFWCIMHHQKSSDRENPSSRSFPGHLYEEHSIGFSRISKEKVYRVFHIHHAYVN